MHPRGRHGGPPWARGNDVPPPADDVSAWLSGRLPDEWYQGAPEVHVDRDEIVIIGELTPPIVEGDPDAAAQAAATAGRITRFREETRGKRMAIAQEAEDRYGRKVAWGARIGESREVFTSLAVTLSRLPTGWVAEGGDSRMPSPTSAPPLASSAAKKMLSSFEGFTVCRWMRWSPGRTKGRRS